MPDFRTLYNQRVNGEVFAQGTLNVRDWNNLLNRPPVARTDASNTFTLNQLLPGVVAGEATSNNARITSRAGTGYDYAHRHRNTAGTRDWGWLVDGAGAWQLIDITAGPLTRLAISAAGGVAIGGATPGAAAGDLTQPLGTSHRFGGTVGIAVSAALAEFARHSVQPFYTLRADIANNPPGHGTGVDFMHSDGTVVTMRRMLTTTAGGALPAGARVCYFAQ